MLPDTVYSESLVGTISPSLTYKIDSINKRIIGTVSEKDAVLQAVQKILYTDRYSCLIYNWYYGNDLYTLLGKPAEYATVELVRIIKESLMQDDRVVDVVDFSYTKSSIDSIKVSFTVVSVYGKFDMISEVSV